MMNTFLQDSELTRMAVELADESARETLTVFSVQKSFDGAKYLCIDDETILAHEHELLARATRYLELRGIVVRHPMQPSFVTEVTPS